MGSHSIFHVNHSFSIGSMHSKGKYKDFNWFKDKEKSCFLFFTFPFSLSLLQSLDRKGPFGSIEWRGGKRFLSKGGEGKG